MFKNIILVQLLILTFIFSKDEGVVMDKKEPKAIGVGGVFFKCNNPEETKKWYKDNLGFPIDEWGTMFKSRDIDNPDLITYLQWSPFDRKTVKVLKERKVTILDEIKDHGEIGKFVHILDLEGNKIELWEPPKLTENQHNEINSLSEHLKLFEQFIGKTFKGEFSNSTKEKPVFDVSHWERVLNGMAIRIIHSVNDGEYGGESIITWNPEKNSLVSSYFTTAGFSTNAVLHFEDDKLISIEDVFNNENGITKVKAIIELLPNGNLRNSSKYFINDAWVDGHVINYKEDSKAKVIFK